MGKVSVVAKRDFLESITSSPRPLLALAELIWNGFDSGADNVSIHVNKNLMHGIDSITVHDNGDGIEFNQVEQLFGNLGESWKKQKGKYNNRALHGKNGRGRFKAFAIGSYVEWNTTYKKRDQLFSYKIIGRSNTLDGFDVTEEKNNPSVTLTGTSVSINNLLKNFHSLQNESIYQQLAQLFAAYLTEYPYVKLTFNGTRVNPKDAQISNVDYRVDSFPLKNGVLVDAIISVIEWKIATDRTINLCDENGVTLHELTNTSKIKTHGFNCTVYIKSSYFKELDKRNSLCLAELDDGVQELLKIAKSKVKSHFRKRLSELQSEIVEKWKRERIYPYVENMYMDSIEQAERQVFDIIAVNVQNYLPSFDSYDLKSKQFTFSLLAQALRQNPESLQSIINEVLCLKRETQDELADLLKKTSLSSIISSSKVVANRLDFLNALEQLIFYKENKKKLLERDQLHKILEKEAWLFHEEFSLSGSEQRLEDVLQKHIGKLGDREDVTDIVDLGDGKTGRIDLMLHKTLQPRTGEYDYLVIELKRPSKKIDAEVITQIEKYAIAVANDERFHGIKTRWTFMAISNELDDYAKRKVKQRDKPIGLVFDDGDLNITVWAKSWADIINDARSKLNFINNQLRYEADKDSAKAYLYEKHEKFIPTAKTTIRDVNSKTCEEVEEFDC